MKIHLHESINLYQNRVKPTSNKIKMQHLKKIKNFSYIKECLQTLSETDFRDDIIFPFKNCVMKILIAKQNQHLLELRLKPSEMSTMDG